MSTLPPAQTLILLFVFLASTAILQGQPWVSGTVLDADDGTPIPFATVYFDGTTNGQTTDERGEFKLSLSGMQLPARLIVSHLGYDLAATEVKAPSAGLVFNMKVQGQDLQQVEVSDRNLRERTLAEFRQKLLGDDDWGLAASIKNEERIVFNRDYKDVKLVTENPNWRRRLVNSKRYPQTWAEDSSYVVQEQPLNLRIDRATRLRIDLPDIGYDLELDLQSFLFDYRQALTSYFGFFFYRPKEGFGEEPRARHRRNRERAYYGSSMHFARSLTTGSLTANGFAVYRRSGKGPQERIEEINLPSYLEPGEAPDTYLLRGLKDENLVILYYGDARGRPLPLKKWKRAKPLESGIKVVSDSCIVRADGTLPDNALLFTGQIATRAGAWLLPSDYHPEEHPE
ncbi:carboxypeptidase-like regulatory domain-containing protein [Lewinella sp. W8]|uniref:carboxypeptidase-like regulatory domain-containing protein n=1 Tax=Lewinella sp. W8 TaxID=2528208 RepID=UPI001067DF85|nr:carboxypeptidase-like regulatory domain-containing protein [Lewinella sp. W8]MTB51556.1 hypothetical protein [Lewinella sp. W8]